MRCLRAVRGRSWARRRAPLGGASHAGGWPASHRIAWSPDIADLEQITPHYEWFEGWQSSTADARTIEALPAQARTYLDRIEELVESPIRYVSVGTRRDQIIGL